MNEDVLVNNAAILGTGELIRTEDWNGLDLSALWLTLAGIRASLLELPSSFCQDGFEECLQVNYLSSLPSLIHSGHKVQEVIRGI